jgi:protein SCO1/2
MNTRSDSFKVLLGVLGGIVAIIVFGLVLSFAPELARNAQPTPTPGGIGVGQYRYVPALPLTNQDGRPMSLADLRGKPVLLAFGYTHCPDVCPLFMSDMRKVKRALGDAGDRAAFVFVSVDPKRDTPEVIKRYVTAFDPAFIGATSDDATLRSLVYAFDGTYEIGEPDAASPNSYLVAHTAFTYLIDAEGKWRLKYPFGTPVDTVVNDMRAILTHTPAIAPNTVPGIGPVLNSPLASPLKSPLAPPAGSSASTRTRSQFKAELYALITTDYASLMQALDKQDREAARASMLALHHRWHIINTAATPLGMQTQVNDIDTLYHNTVYAPLIGDTPDFNAVRTSAGKVRKLLDAMYEGL